MGTNHGQSDKTARKEASKQWRGKTAKELLKGKHAAIFRILRTVQNSVVEHVLSLPEPKTVTDTIVIAPTEGGFAIAGSIESPIEPRFIKKRGVDISIGRLILTLNGEKIHKAPQSVAYCNLLSTDVLRAFLKGLGEYDHDAEVMINGRKQKGIGFPYKTIEHSGTKGRTIDQSLSFIVDVCSKLKLPPQE